MRGKIAVPLPNRFWPKLEWQSNGCWKWTGFLRPDGYGHIRVKKDGEWTWEQAHRVSFRLIKGEIPKGMQLDHLCRNPWCCHPYHLEIVTPKENVKRSRKPLSPTCGKGHVFDASNTYIRRDKGTRMCMKCHNLAQNKRYSKK